MKIQGFPACVRPIFLKTKLALMIKVKNRTKIVLNSTLNIGAVYSIYYWLFCNYLFSTRLAKNKLVFESITVPK